jgi:hypothetical protein
MPPHSNFFRIFALEKTRIMSVWCIILMVWLVFCIAVYLFAATDFYYYANSVADKFHRVIDAITEDE